MSTKNWEKTFPEYKMFPNILSSLTVLYQLYFAQAKYFTWMYSFSFYFSGPLHFCSHKQRIMTILHLVSLFQVTFNFF